MYLHKLDAIYKINHFGRMKLFLLKYCVCVFCFFVCSYTVSHYAHTIETRPHVWVAEPSTLYKH